ncbi:MAG: nitroreductase family deazaflavin-dependent oxidoreductase [bacterium]|nr:nitroreductase family deazaflavin-dependent oxidoreductase [bacterium]MCP4966831.1 nitroreductase family deazaflavin-dependent oxidoreductase [bacterium]
MDADVQQALETDRVIDITTIGRYSGEQRRIEIWFHNVEGRIYITGTPGPRSWYANLMGNAAFTIHLKESLRRDLPAMAIPVVGEERRRPVLAEITSRVAPDASLDNWVEGSPLVEVRL